MNTCETCRYYMASPLQEPIETINREDTAYYDGVYDAIREIKNAMAQEVST